MTVPPKILVPIDFSEMSRRALAWAVDHASRTQGELHLLHVVEYHLSDLVAPYVPEGDDKLNHVAKEAELKLHELVPGSNKVYRHVAIGRPSHEIVRLADKLAAASIVMGSHGRTGIARLVIGSVAEYVVRHAVCPVVVIKPPRDGDVAK
jgi:universal stress protein A